MQLLEQIKKFLNSKALPWSIICLAAIAVWIVFYEPWNPKPISPSASTTPSGDSTGYEPNRGKLPEKSYDVIMSKLIKQLPYRGDGFRITFDYKENRFMVSSFPIGNPTYKQDFLTWHQASEYNAIPLKWFIFGI